MKPSLTTAAVLFLVSTIAFSFYLWTLYGQLKKSFDEQQQFVPTRIYSDVTRVVPAQPRPQIEERLKSLGYRPRVSEETLTFTLNPINYPIRLIPEDHPQLDNADGHAQSIVFRFDSAEKDALLQAIELDGHEVPDLYLEPELVATLSRGATSKEIRKWVPFKLDDDDSEFPPYVWKAIIAVEDHRFLEHGGFDPRGIARAIWVNLKTLRFEQGGSTLTQQLVKNLMERRTKNVFRKVNELFLAVLLELTFSKEKILERYLNEVYLGQVGNLEVHGVPEGAKHFFGKSLKDLNLGEITMLAGLIRGPHYYSPYRSMERARSRQKEVLDRMVATGALSEEEAKEALTLPIRLAPPPTNKAPYFTDFVKAELLRILSKDKGMTEQEIINSGLRVYTTLDARLNAIAQQALSGGVSRLEKKLKLKPTDRLEGALACVNHANGFIRALIGGRSYSQSTFNRILNMKRQVGSTFKPIVYLAAFAKGADHEGVAFGPAHPAEDAAWTLVFDKGRQSWTPRNYEKEFLGWINYRKALAHSINTVTARLGQEVGIDNVINTAHAIGIDSELPAVPSLALGVAELSPVELLRAYSVIANHGVQEELTVIRSIAKDDGSFFAQFSFNPKPVVEPGPADLVTEMLKSVFTEGTARGALSMGFDRPAAGKTGTTSHHRDAWFAGYTPQLTTVVWVGMDQAPKASADDDEKETKAFAGLTGASSALPIWAEFMKNALASETPDPFPVSPHLVDVTIDQRTGKQAEPDCPLSQVIVEKYIKGKEPATRSCSPFWPASTPKTVTNE